jgi:glycosyltransferase involved in cell wall biosynthesis
VRRLRLARFRVRGFPVADGRAHEPVPERLVLRSRVFDRDWYELQAGRTFPDDRAAIAHYLDHGRVTGFTPAALFDPAYLDPSGWKSADQDPLVTYLCGATADRDPHPLFNEVKQRAKTASIRADLPGLVGFFAVSPAKRALLSLSGVSWTQARSTLVRSMTLEPGTWPAPHPAHPLPPPGEAAPEGAVVSVVLPVRDRPLHVLTAITSVRAQTYPAWELVVVDDGSSDQTPANLALMAADDERIRVVRGAGRGVAAARNLGITAASGAYIAFLDSDYLWEPTHLEGALAELRAAGTGAVQTGTRRRVGRDWADTGPPSHSRMASGPPRADLNGLVVTRAVATEAGSFDEGLARGSDLDWYWRVLSVGAVARTDSAMALEHVDPSLTGSLSRTHPQWWLDVAFSHHLVDWDELRAESRDRPAGVTFVFAARADRAQAIDRVRALRAKYPAEQVEVIVWFNETGPRAVWSSAYTVLEARLGATVLLHPAATTGPSAMSLAAGRGRRVLVLGDDQADDLARVGDAVANGPAKVRSVPRVAGSHVGRLAADCTVVSAADFAELDGYEPKAFAGVPDHRSPDHPDS